MKIRAFAFVAALVCCGSAVAQASPQPPLLAQVAPPQAAPRSDPTVDIWSHMSVEQRRQLWQQLTPEERASIWNRLPPEQRGAIRERLQQGREFRDKNPGAAAPPAAPPPAVPREGAAPREAPVPGRPPGFRLSPEERRQLREQIREAHREMRRGRGRP